MSELATNSIRIKPLIPGLCAANLNLGKRGAGLNTSGKLYQAVVTETFYIFPTKSSDIDKSIDRRSILPLRPGYEATLAVLRVDTQEILPMFGLSGPPTDTLLHV